MFAYRWFEVFVLVLSVVKTMPTCVEDEDFPWFSHDECKAEAEQILSVQSSLRRHLMGSLVQIRESIIESQGFDSVIGAIIRDLQTRDLDPFKLLTPANSTQEQLNTSLIEEALHNLQVGVTPIGYSSSFRGTQVPNIQLSPEHRQKIHETGEPFVEFVLKEIQKGSLKLNSRLLGDVLYNYRFKNHSPELIVILERVNETINRNFDSSWRFSRYTTAFKPPDDVLSDILTSISLKVPPGKRHQIDQLLSALPDERNSIQLKKTRTWYGFMEDDTEKLFDLILEDDYPPDVIYAKNALSNQIRHGDILSDVNYIVNGNPPMEKLLMVLSSLNDYSYLQNYVQVVYTHVKLRYLASRGRFFRPETEADLEFLFNSFLTYNCDWSRMVLKEVQEIFVLSRWKEVLKDFEYRRYSKPRSLVLGMVEGLLKKSTELPLCSIITLRYFLREHENVTKCTADKSSEGLTVVGSAIRESLTVTNIPEKPSPVATTTASPSLNPPKSSILPSSEHYSQLYSSITNTSVSPTPVSSDHPRSTSPVLSPGPTPPQASPSPVATNPHNDSTDSSPTEIHQSSATTQLSTEDTSETSPNTNVTQQNEETRRSTVQLTPDEYPTSETRASVDDVDSASAEPSNEPDTESENSGTIL